MSLDHTPDTDTPLASTLVEQFAAKRHKLIDPALLPNPATSPTQQRVEGLDPDTVARYAEAYRAGAPVPAIKLFIERVNGEDVYHYGDGHHRVAAARKAKLAEIEYIAEKGTARDARLYAVGANAEHGLRRTNADLRHSVSTMLTDDEWKTWSNRVIAHRTRTSESFVRVMRKELKAEVSEIRRKDGTSQRPRNSVATKPQQQTLFDPDLTPERERFDAVMPLLACGGSGFEGLHEAKRAMIAAAYASAPLDRADPGCIRDALRVISGHVPDTHLSALERRGMLECDSERKLWRLTPPTRRHINEILRAAATIMGNEAAAPDVRPKTGPAAWSFDGDFDIGRHLLGWISGTDTGSRELANITGIEEVYVIDALDTMVYAGLLGRVADIAPPLWEITAAGKKAVCTNKSIVCATNTQVRHWHNKHSEKALAQTKPAAAPATDEIPDTDGPEEVRPPANITPAGQQIEQTDTPTVADTSVAKDHPGYPGGPGQAVPMQRQPDGSYTGTATSDPPAERSLELRRVDKQREILQHKLLRNKTTWTGSDQELYTLAMLAGIPCRPVAWIDAVKAQARDMFIDVVRGEVADRVRTGEAVNIRKWPQLAEICRLFDLDHQAIEIEAERAVPE